MTGADLSFQRRDPLASYAMRPITFAVSAGIVAVAIGGTIDGWSRANPLIALLAALAAVLAASAAVYWSSPLRAPFSTLGAVVVMLLATATVVLSAASTWRISDLVVLEWPVVVFGLCVAQLAPYRPSRDLMAATVLGAIGVAFVAILEPIDPRILPPLVAVVATALPILGIGLGAADYARVLAGGDRTWYSRSAARQRMPNPAITDDVVRSVHDDRVNILNHTVVPFFTDLLLRGEITDDDRSRALGISNSIRAAMVADVDRSWLDTILDDLAQERGDGTTPGSEVVQDPDRLATQMSTEQRIVVRAVVIALFDHPGFDADGFGIVIAPEKSATAVTLTAKLDADESLPRTGLGPYLAVLRIAFGGLTVTFQPPTLTLKFSYDHK